MKSLLFYIFIFLAAACITVPVASRFKLGSVLGYLAAGILIGPFGFGLIKNTDQIMHFAEYGIVMMLFLIGLELDPAMLWRLRKSIIGMGGLQVLFTSLALMLVGMAFGFDWRLSLACGMALSLSSTAIVLQILHEKGLLHTILGESAFSVLLFQDIAVIPILVIMPLLAHVSPDLHTTTLQSTLPGWIYALLVLGVIAVVIVIGKYFSRYIFRFIAKTNLREIFTATSLVLVVGITLLMQEIGVSPALGAFIAGVVLANSEYRHTLESDIEPFKGLLLGLFFISIGMGMDFTLLAHDAGLLVAAVTTLIIVKIFLLFLLGRYFGLENAQNIGFSLALAQGGEFAFVLFQYTHSLALIDNYQAKFLALTVALSMAATPILMMFYSRFIMPLFVSMLPQPVFDSIEEENHPVILAGYGRFGQIAGRFMTAQGVKITILEKDPDQVERLRRFGIKGYFGDASKLDLLRSAGIQKAKLLIIAIDDPDKALEIVALIKHEFPQVKIFARARNRRHAYELHKAGADYIRRELFDASLALAQEAMKILGKAPAEIKHKASQFTQHDEKALQASFAFFEQEPELISFSKQATKELERILQGDFKDPS